MCMFGIMVGIIKKIESATRVQILDKAGFTL